MIYRETVTLTTDPTNVLANLQGNALIPLDYGGALVSFAAVAPVGSGVLIDSFTIDQVQYIERAQAFSASTPKEALPGDMMIRQAPASPGDFIACIARGSANGDKLSYMLVVEEVQRKRGTKQLFLSSQLITGAGSAGQGPAPYGPTDVLLDTAIRQVPTGRRKAAVSIALAEAPPGKSAGTAWVQDHKATIYFNDRLIVEDIAVADWGIRGNVQIPDNLVIENEVAMPGEIIRLIIQRGAEPVGADPAWEGRRLQYRVNVELL